MTEEFRFSLIAAAQDRSKPLRDRLGEMGKRMGCSPLDGEGDGVETALWMTSYYADRSDSIREAGEGVLARYGESPARFWKDRDDFDARFPDWERFWEQMLVNHMFFTQFPYYGIAREESWKSLAAVYGLTRFLAAGTLAGRAERGGEEDRNALIDVLAAAFRLIAHTPFERSVSTAMGSGRGGELLCL